MEILAANEDILHVQGKHVGALIFAALPHSVKCDKRRILVLW
jgi:hypothetical protein